MYIVLVGLNHKSAPLSVREKISVTERQKETLYRTFRAYTSLKSLVVFSTCNRTEACAVTTDPETGARELEDIFLSLASCDREEIRPYLYNMECYAAVSHLFHVASGLDSMVLGETQILGQMKTAYQHASACGAADSVMHQLMQKTFSAAKKVHTLTAINDNPSSVSYIAIERAKKHCGTLQGKKVLVTGAGKAGQLTARYLKGEGVKAVFVSNRSAEVARELAKELDGKAVPFEDLPSYLREVDVVISCTGACHTVIHGEECLAALRAREGKPVIMIDIAVPRDIDPALGEVPGVALCDMDDLQKTVVAYAAERSVCAGKAEQILAEEIEAFRNWSDALRITPVIAALKRHGEEVRKRELKRAINRMSQEGISAQQERVISEMARAIVNQMLRQPVENLRMYHANGEGEAYATHVRNIFSLDLMEQIG